MYNVAFPGSGKEDLSLFGPKYELTEDLTQANVIVPGGSEISPVTIASKLVFAVTDIGGDGDGSFEEIPEDLCSSGGIAIFGEGAGSDKETAIKNTRDFIENGNVVSSVNFPDVSLGDFGDDVSRISIVMRSIDKPILMAAMMFSGIDIKRIAGGTKGDISYALVAGNEPVTSVPKVDGIIKVRVLQDI